VSDVGEPGAEQDKRRRVVLAVGLTVLAVALIAFVVFALGGDDDDGDTSSTTSTTSSTSSTVASTTSTTEPAATTTTTAGASTTTAVPPVTAVPAQCAEAGSDPSDPGPAAQAVFIAWTRGDTACAAELMTPEAQASLFARDGSGATDMYQGCSEVTEPDPEMDCAFTYEGGSTHYRMNFSPTDGWTVFEVYQVAD
jgi:hypothetical protein